jgi:hypothetical protein
MPEIFDHSLEQTPDEILSGFAENTLYADYRPARA